MESSSGDIYSAPASIEDDRVPEDPTGKLVRMQSVHQHLLFKSTDQGTRTRLIYIAEFNFGGNVPKSLI